MSLKELLGEELYSQVIEKAGDNKLAIVSDGNWFPKDKFNELNTEKKNLEQQLSGLQETLESNKEKLDGISDLEQQIESYKLKDLKTNIAIQANIPLDLASRLSGETEEEIKADAEKLAGYVNKKQPLPLKQTEPPVDNKTAGLNSMLDNLTNKN